MAWRYQKAVTELVFKWLNPRSQRKSDPWEKFLLHRQGEWEIPRPRALERWPFLRFPSRRSLLIEKRHGKISIFGFNYDRNFSQLAAVEKGETIFVDAGHGGRDVGTVSNNLKESEVA